MNGSTPPCGESGRTSCRSRCGATFPSDDQRAEKLAQAHIAFYRAYDPDLLKVTPASGYYGDDWGLRAGYKPNREGVAHVRRAADQEAVGLGAAQASST